MPKIKQSESSQRCDVKWVFASEKDKCPNRQLFSPTTEIKVAPPHNLPLGGRRSDGVTIIQLEPQQVEIRMKPGNGYEVRDFTIQTSEFRSLGIDIEFTIECNGEKIIGRVCPGIKPDQKISFNATVSLKDCSKPNLAAVSVGIYGYNTVSAIFITPICGCECEHSRQQERRSPRCSYSGNLVCGVCQCDHGKGGISGRYCECDSSSCPLSVSGQICSGRGTCQCGKCVCERGYSGEGKKFKKKFPKKNIYLKIVIVMMIQNLVPKMDAEFNSAENAEVHGEVLTEDDLDYKTSSQNGDFLPTPKSTIESIQEAQSGGQVSSAKSLSPLILYSSVIGILMKL
uniref:Integrin beta n=1 Tax=Meloidogyne javanica TaxID=6303 RepID=A0A915N8E8_MELJA